MAAPPRHTKHCSSSQKADEVSVRCWPQQSGTLRASKAAPDLSAPAHSPGAELSLKAGKLAARRSSLCLRVASLVSRYLCVVGQQSARRLGRCNLPLSLSLSLSQLPSQLSADDDLPAVGAARALLICGYWHQRLSLDLKAVSLCVWESTPDSLRHTARQCSAQLCQPAPQWRPAAALA